jgi:molybdopterin synthase sulfur carrier subunit
MAIVHIPSLMRDLTGGQAEVSATGRTVGQVIDALEAQYPGVRERLCEGGRISPQLSVSVDGRLARLGLAQPVRETSEILFLPLVGGG